MQTQDLDRLLENITQGTASDQEIRLFNRYYQSYQSEESAWEPKTMGDRQQVHDELKQLILRKIRNGKVVPFWSKTYYIAAAVAAMLLISYVFFFSVSDDREHILAGKNTAILTLSNGRSIALSDNKQGLVIDPSKIRYDDGSLVLAQTDSASLPTEKLTITTPKGGTYEVILTDGTHVWLNADSKLIFPAQFSEKKRTVSLIGEGYFEVERNNEKPFEVLSLGQSVQVLGTHFNINAYENEKSIKTTLLEGSVVVNSDLKYKFLKPGDQAVNADKQIKVSRVNVNIPVAWKNKQFLFEGDNIETIMRIVERWYNIEVSYSGKISNETFSGGVSRFDNLSEVLSSLESTGKVKFEVKGRKVRVSM